MLIDIAEDEKNTEKLQAAFNVVDRLNDAAETLRSPECAKEAKDYHSYLFSQLEIVTMPLEQAQSHFQVSSVA